MKKSIGYILLSSPFIGVSIHIVLVRGWLPLLVVWGVVLTLLGILYVGVRLIME